MSRRILIVRLSAIGDVVMASGLIPALRARWPDAHLAWLVEPPVRELLADNPRLDEVIVWPRGEWRQLARERRYGELARRVRAFVRELRARRFDLALDLQGLLKSALWTRLSGAPERLAIGPREGAQWLATRALPRRSDDVRIGSEYRRLARELGAAEGDFRLDLVVGPAAHAAADAALRTALGLAGDAPIPPFVALAPFTTRPQKHWFAERWAALAPQLAQTFGGPVVLLGGPGDRAAAAGIAAATPGLIDLSGRTRLAGTVAVIGRARLLIGVDTGLTHMGLALGVPTLALFGSTRPYLDTGSPDARVLWSARDCSPCRRHPSCHGRFDCMRDHTPASVLAAARALPALHAAVGAQADADADAAAGRAP